jgi:hypothetical protein
MVSQFDYFASEWIRGHGRSAEWQDHDFLDKSLIPQFLMGFDKFANNSQIRKSIKFAVMRVSSATNKRTLIASLIPGFPAQHSLFTGTVRKQGVAGQLAVVGVLNSLVFDFVVRQKCAGVNVTASVIDECPLPSPKIVESEAFTPYVLNVAALSLSHLLFAVAWSRLSRSIHRDLILPVANRMALTKAERIRRRSMCDAVVAFLYGLKPEDFLWIIRDCDRPKSWLAQSSNVEALSKKGFWRVDKDQDPELRATVLAYVAFEDLSERVRLLGGDVSKGICDFFAANDGQGWMLPASIRLSDYGLGHDRRAEEEHPVAEILGDRYSDIQLRQNAEEQWMEILSASEQIHNMKIYSDTSSEDHDLRQGGTSSRSQAHMEGCSQEELFINSDET